MSLSLIRWRYACILLYHIWIVGIKLLSGCRIFRQFFSACTLISDVCLYSFIIIALSQLGDGCLQYCVILSTAFNLSTIWWVSNCSYTIWLFLSTDCCCKVTRHLLTGWQTLYLKTPSSKRVETLIMKELWSPGLSANNSIPNWYGASQCGKNVTPPNLSLGLFLYHFLHTMSLWRHEPIHNNTNNQQTPPPWWLSRLPFQRRGFDKTTPPDG